MFENYKITKEDICAIKEAIKIVHSKKVAFFPRNGLNKIDVVLFDSKYLYIWSERRYNLKKIGIADTKQFIYRWKHGEIITDYAYLACGGTIELNKVFKKIFKILNHYNFFFCPPLTCFIKSQKCRKSKNNAFTTRESYIFSIIHEFGHLYYHLHTKRQNDEKVRRLLHQSRKAWKSTKINLPNLPIPEGFISELFAALCDITVSKTLESKYYIDLRKKILANFRKTSFSGSYLDEPHRYAYILAPIYAQEHDRWYEDLLTIF